jgi:hypothetical protein
MAKSFVDYMVTYIGHKFLSDEDKKELGLINGNGEINGKFNVEIIEEEESKVVSASAATMDAPICACGAIMVKAGACFTCPNCFATTGVCS